MIFINQLLYILNTCFASVGKTLSDKFVATFTPDKSMGEFTRTTFKITTELHVPKWLNENKLNLNVNKTNYMLIFSKCYL